MQPPPDPLPPIRRPAAAENPYAPPPAPAAATASALEYIVPTGPTVQRSPLQWRAHIRQRIRRHVSAHHVWQEAVSEGLNAVDAQRFIDEEVSSLRSGAVIMIVVGVLIALLGAVVTIATFLAATRQPGGQFFIWFGPVLFGGCVALVGIVRLLRSIG